MAVASFKHKREEWVPWELRRAREKVSKWQKRVHDLENPNLHEKLFTDARADSLTMLEIAIEREDQQRRGILTSSYTTYKHYWPEYQAWKMKAQQELRIAKDAEQARKIRAEQEDRHSLAEREKALRSEDLRLVIDICTQYYQDWKQGMQHELWLAKGAEEVRKIRAVEQQGDRFRYGSTTDCDKPERLHYPVKPIKADDKAGMPPGKRMSTSTVIKPHCKSQLFSWVELNVRLNSRLPNSSFTDHTDDRKTPEEAYSGLLRLI
ncbi:hypothetical protein ACLMJK_000017 [Lecanora helva]